MTYLTLPSTNPYIALYCFLSISIWQKVTHKPTDLWWLVSFLCASTAEGTQEHKTRPPFSDKAPHRESAKAKAWRENYWHISAYNLSSDGLRLCQMPHWLTVEAVCSEQVASRVYICFCRIYVFIRWDRKRPYEVEWNGNGALHITHSSVSAVD